MAGAMAGAPWGGSTDGSHLAALWGMAGLSAAHAFMPPHWLPFVVVSRARGWALPETLGVTALAGLAHSCTTIAVGAGAVLAAETLLSKGVLGWVGNGVLLCMGLVYLTLHVHGGGSRGEGHAARCHHPGHDHGHRTASDASGAAAAAALVIFPAVAPCPSSVPLFLAVGGAGTAALVQLSLVFAACTVLVMVGLVGLSHGLLRSGGDKEKDDAPDLHGNAQSVGAGAREPMAMGPCAKIGHFLERNDRLAVGLCLAVVGLLGLLFPDGDHGHDNQTHHGHGVVDGGLHTHSHNLVR